MENFSVTQAANITAFAGAVVVISKAFGKQFDQSQVEALIGASIVIVSIAISFANRYMKGDLTAIGARIKQPALPAKKASKKKA